MLGWESPISLRLGFGWGARGNAYMDGLSFGCFLDTLYRRYSTLLAHDMFASQWGARVYPYSMHAWLNGPTHGP